MTLAIGIQAPTQSAAVLQVKAGPTRNFALLHQQLSRRREEVRHLLLQQCVRKLPNSKAEGFLICRT